MIKLYEIEIEFIKVFLLGSFMGWQFCKYFIPDRKMKWTEIKNVRFSFMNKNHKI